MTAHDESFSSIYTPLPHLRCTRLLRILGSTPMNHDKLELEISLLDISSLTTLADNAIKAAEHEGYDALSYTWGPPLATAECERDYSPDSDVSVIVQYDGRQGTTTIGRNLYEGLLHIWTMGRRRHIWVDYLCINQQDLAEKATHILLMGDIFSGAETVLVWFGRDDPDLPTFDDVIWLHGTVLDSIYENNANQGSLTREGVTLDTDAHGSINGIKLFWRQSHIVIPKAYLRSLYRFYARRRYLSRAWVVQEIALSRSALALIGEDGISFDRLAKLAQISATSDITRLAPLYSTSTGTETGNVGDGSELQSLFTILQQRESLGLGGDMSAQLSKIYGCHDKLTLFLAAIEYYITELNWRRATDARDLLYSLLGMARFHFPIEKVPIIPNYSKPLDEVFLEFATQSLTNLPYRTILCLVRHAETYASRPVGDVASYRPSWVPDFRNLDFGFTTLQTAQTALWQSPAEFSAGLEGSEVSYLEIAGGALTLFARKCGVINHTFKPAKPKLESDTYNEHLLRELTWISRVLEECASMEERHATGEHNLEAMFRILTDEAMDLQSSQERQDRVKNFLCMAITETECVFHDHSELMMAAQQMRRILLHLEGQPGVPTSSELERFKSTFAAVQQCGARDDEDISREIAMLWPEKQIILGSGKVDSNAEAVLLHDLQKRADVRLHHDHVIFSTENRYLGRALSHVGKDDELWLICQAQVPFVLRPRSDNNYMLVGETFVHGAMFGELIENGVAGEPQLITIV